MKKNMLITAVLLCAVLIFGSVPAFAAELTVEAAVESIPTLTAEIAEVQIPDSFDADGFVDEPIPLSPSAQEEFPEADPDAFGGSGETPVQATSSVTINATSFPDANFRSYVSTNFDKDKNGTLSVSEIEAVTEISVYNKGIANLSGVGYFTNLESLSCGGNNTFARLGLSANTALKELYCYNNSTLTELSISNYHQLKYLDCENSTALTRLVCYNCALTYLNVQGCTALTYLDCDTNQLTSLNVGDLTKLETLYCNKNSLTTLDVSGKTALKNLYCANNKLTSLNTDKCSSLTTLNCSSNSLTTLDVSSYKKLTTLNVYGNQTLTRLTCVGCSLTDLNIRACEALTRLDCTNNALTDLYLDDSPALQYLLCTSNQLKSLSVSKNTQLFSLECGNNQLTSLDVSKNAKLDALDCYGNQLTSLDVSKNPVLRYLRCCLNSITSLDVTACPILAEAYLSGSRTEESFMGEKIWRYAGSTGILYIDKTTAVRAAQPITSVSLTIKEPKFGTLPDYKPVLESGANYYLADVSDTTTQNDIVWYNLTYGEALNTSYGFSPGCAYEVRISLTPKTGYKFSSSMTVKVNGKTAVSGLNGEKLVVSFTFPALPDPISSVSVTINEPRFGYLPDYNVLLPDDAYYYSDNTANNPEICVVNNIRWTDITADQYMTPGKDLYNFGHDYRVEITLSAKDGYIFSSIGMSGTINGNPADLIEVTDLNGRYVYLSYVFHTLSGYKPIDSIDITIAEPKAGAYPDYSPVLPSGAGYILMSKFDAEVEIQKNGVAWRDVTDNRYLVSGAEPFCVGHAYQLGVVLVAKEGYAFYVEGTTVDMSSFSGQYCEYPGKITVNGESVSGSLFEYHDTLLLLINYDFPTLPEAKTLSSIKVTKAPTKTTYTEGEKFDKTGMVVTATYSDNTTQKVTGYTFTPTTALKTTDTKITISYTEGGVTKTTTVTITVKAKPGTKTLSSIKVTKAPAKTVYNEGELFQTAFMVVTATYSDGSTKDVTGYTYSPNGKLKATDTKITISYTEGGVTKTATTPITVKGSKTLESIRVTTAPTKIAYIEGETFQKKGMVVKATYSDGSTAAVTTYTYKPTTALKTTDTKITISYTEGGVTKTATQAITVKAKTLTGIKITTPPTKTNYTEGEKFSKTGMVVTASYDNGTTAKVTDFTFKPTTALKTTDTKITISYTENGVTKTATQAITVKAKSGTVLRGDVNGDGKVNSNDAIHLLRHTMNKDRFPINQSGDMNGDGKVNSNDAIHLLRYTMSPDRFPLKG